MEIGISHSDIVLRLLVAAILGMILGVERVVAGKTAGMRTYALVSMGAALFVIVSYAFPEIYLNATKLDPARIASQVVVGIGFIGAGLIIFREDKVQGLTTAAGLWVVAGVGLAAGYGLFMLASVATLISLLIFTGGWYLEAPIKKLGAYYRYIEEQDKKEK